MGQKKGGIMDFRLRFSFAVALVMVVVAIGVYSSSFFGSSAKGGSKVAYAQAVGEPHWDDVWLLSRMVAAEAKGEPFQGQVAVAAVILNRVRSSKFPGSVSEVLFEPWAFEPILNGSFWSTAVTEEHLRAAQLALSGWDPSYGSLFFWNPATSSSPWIWSRRIVVGIGRHVFGL